APMAAGWQSDPTGRHEYRYWDGRVWTDDVSDAGVAGTDPMPLEASTATESPTSTAFTPPPRRGSSKRVPVIAGVAAVVVLLVGFLALRGGGGGGGGGASG